MDPVLSLKLWYRMEAATRRLADNGKHYASITVTLKWIDWQMRMQGLAD